jgi:hypothetical protein
VNDCPTCGGPPVLLGTLGRVTWLRCRDCGWEYQADGPIGPGDDDEDEAILHDCPHEDPPSDTGP